MGAGGAPEQADFDRFVGHFAEEHKAELTAADTRAVHFAPLGRFDFAFIYSGHDREQALHDSRGAYTALEPGGLVCRDVGRPLP